MDRLSALSGTRLRRRVLSFSGLIDLMAALRTRRRLMELDEHLLRDIGLTRSEAQTEAEKPAWDVPAGWLR